MGPFILGLDLGEASESDHDSDQAKLFRDVAGVSFQPFSSQIPFPSPQINQEFGLLASVFAV